jgi:hypothetical protein
MTRSNSGGPNHPIFYACPALLPRCEISADRDADYVLAGGNFNGSISGDRLVGKGNASPSARFPAELCQQPADETRPLTE